MNENEYWKTCEAIDNRLRLAILRYLIIHENTEYPSVCQLADFFGTSEPSMSVHLKKLAHVGLVCSKRAERRVYYRAFPTTPSAVRTIEALRVFFASKPDENRMLQLLTYVHALSHHRRNAIVRCLHENPGLSLEELSTRTEMPPATADRLVDDLDHARIVNLDSVVVPPVIEPEATLLSLTLD